MTGYEIVFDGGSLGNPGRGYGSYAVYAGDVQIRHEQLSFDYLGDQVTNNQAEYLSLINALEWLVDRHPGDAGSVAVTIYGDSQLVINQLAGRWKVKNEGLRPLWRHASALITRFGEHDLRWHDRSNSVRILGH